MLLEQFAYVAILILIGVIVLSLRRKAEGSRTGYKLILVLIGVLLGISLKNDYAFISFDAYFLKALVVFLLVVLLFELSVRLNPDNISLTPRSISMFFCILAVNIVLLGISTTLLLNIPFVQGVVFAILLSSVEYFLVDSLKSEGDLANPLVLFFAFSIVLFYGLQGHIFENLIYFLKYVVIGLGTGVFIGIIVFRILRNRRVTPANELGLISVAVLTYIITEQLSGSGLFAVLILGTFFGNSYVRKTSNMYNFSPFIFKTLEMLIYLLIGFVLTIDFSNGILWKALLLFLAYILLRLLMIQFYFRHYSFGNKLLLTFAPKGMILGVAILVLGTYGTVTNLLLNVMLIVLIYSLLAGVFVEYIEQQKSLRLDKLFKLLVTKRFGRKKDIMRRKKT
jgi:NhaP-type Na+/H+ or K+/H+ antiporter